MTDKLMEKLDEVLKALTLQTAATRDIFPMDEAAQFLGLSKSQVYKLTSSRQIPYYCPNGKKCYFLKKDLTEWMLRNRKSTQEEIQLAAITNVTSRRSR